MNFSLRLIRLFLGAMFICCLSSTQSASAQMMRKMNFSIDPTYEYTFQELMIEGGEGYKLFTKIYLPEGKGPWPVVMTRTPYAYGENKGDNVSLGQEYAKRGLGYVVQYCRGKGGSEGFYRPK